MSQITEAIRQSLNVLCERGGVIGGDVALWLVLHNEPDVPLVQLGLIEVFVPAQFDASGIDLSSNQIQLALWPASAQTPFETIAHAAVQLEHWKVLNPAHLLVRLLDLHSEQREPHCAQALADAISAVGICLGETQRVLAFEAMGAEHRKRFSQIARQFENTHY